MSTGLSRDAYLDAVRKNEGIPFLCEPCRADALESLAMPVRDSTHIAGDSATLPSMDASIIAAAVPGDSSGNDSANLLDEQQSNLGVSDSYDVFLGQKRAICSD